MALLAADAAVAGVAAQTRALAFLEDKPSGGTFQRTLQLQVDSYQDRCRQYSTTHLDHVMAAVDAVVASDKDRWHSPDGQATLKRYLHKCNLVLSSALATALQSSLRRYAASFHVGDEAASTPLFHVALVDREIAIDPPTEEAPELWGRLLDDVVEHVQQLPVLKWGAGMELAKVPSKKQSMAIALAAQAVPAVRTSVREQVTAFTRTLHQAIDQWATLRAVAFTAQYATPSRFCYWRRGSTTVGSTTYTFGASWRNASTNPLINPQQRSRRVSHAIGGVAAVAPAQLSHGHARGSIVDADAQELNESEMQHRIDRPLQDFITALSVLQAEYDKLLEELRRMDGARVGVYRVECKSLIALVHEAAEQQRDCALRSLQVHTRDMCLALRAHLRANQALLRLPLPSVTPEQFVAMEALIHNYEAERADVHQSINELAEQLALLEECRIPLSDSEVDGFWRVVRAHARGDTSVSDTAERAAAARPLVARGVRAAHAVLVDDVAVLVRRAVAWESAEDTQPGRVAEVWQEVAEGLEAMHAARRELDNMEVQAEGLGFELGEECAQLLDPALDAARPLALLWETAFEWCQAMQQWCSVPFRQLNATAMQSELTALSRKVTQLTRLQKDKSPGLRSPSSQKVLWEVKQRVDAMSSSMAAIARLRHPGMRRRHWDMLARDLGPSALAAADDSATLPTILAMPLAAKHDVVAAVVGRAMQEHSLEQSLETMEREFRSATLAVVIVAGEATTNNNNNNSVSPEEERRAASGSEPPASMVAGEAGEGGDVVVVAEQQGRQSSQRMVLTGVEEAERLLEEQAVTLKALLNSPFVGPYERAVRNWQDKVAHVRDVVSQLAACQRQWTFFQSVFRSLHVRGQLKEEARKYEAMEATWGWLAALVGRVRGLAAVCESPMLANHLRECRSVTEGLMHRLTAYLEEKRAAFPRFFLLSNTQLLDVMSHEHDPASLLVSSNATTHVLSPCFRALKAIHLTPDVHVRALQGEEPNCELVLRRHVPCEGLPIEKWLANTLTEARASLLAALRNRLEALPDNSDEARLGKDVDAADVHKATTTDVFRAATSLLGESDKADRGERQHKQQNSIQAAANFMLLASAWRTELSQPFPTQVFALASRIAFARRVERAVLSSSNGHAGIGGVYVGGSSHVLLAAEHAQRVHHLAVLVLKTLVMHGIYERDVLSRLLSMELIASVDDFEWQRCLRYYWQNNKCYVEMGSVRLEYGCEYEGESSGSSLVLTPQTERCHLALLSATRSTLAGGGAVGLRGPGGCGKTETVREAARAAGKLCVVLPCGSEGGGDPVVVVRELVAGLKGVVASGAWGVLDGLHALGPGVMSVLATVISTIHRAVKVASPSVAIEGATLRLDTTCVVCFTCADTMKDSAAPDNLRSVLRPMTVLEPDVGHAAAVLLAAEGFQHAHALANKLALCYRLAREQLPCGEEIYGYDFGMRAVKLVVRTMAALLLAQTMDARQSCTEDAMLHTAIQRCNEFRLMPPDARAFASITTEVFPGLSSTHPPTSSSTALLTALQTRRAAIVLGGIAAGKTTCWKTSAATTTTTTDVEVVYPAALTDGTLYGEVARGGHAWSDGVIPAALHRASAGNTSTHHHWLVFDAPSLAPLWAEGLSPLLGDVGEDVVGGHACGGVLTLANGDRVAAPPRNFSIIFEVASLEGVSPGLVSRCGVVYVDGTSVTWRKVYKAWLEALPVDIAPNKELLRRFGEAYVPDMWDVMKEACPDVVEVAVAQTLVKYMQAFFQAAGVWKVSQREESQQQHQEAGGKSAVEGARHSSKWRNINKGWRRHVVGITSQVALYKLNDEAYLSPPTSPGGHGGNEDDDLHSPHADKFVDVYWASHAFLFALVWAYGGPLHASQRHHFDHVLRTCLARDEHNSPASEAGFPAEGTVFDYVYDNITQRWRRWMDKGRLYHSVDTSSSSGDEGGDGLNIVVPESLPVAVMMERLLAARVGVLVVGEPAAGKTALLMRLLNKKRAEHTHVTVAFKLNCASTPAGITETVSSKLQRHKSGAMEPPPPQQLVVFIDDISSAPLDSHGSAPTLEILRQVLERSGWHARASTSVSSSTPTFTPVSRTTFLISARHVPAHDARAVRHVARLRLCSMASSSLRGVFTALLRNRTRELRGASGIGGVGEQSLADAAVEVYETVRKEFDGGDRLGGICCFDMRDLLQVVKGLCHADLEHIKEPLEVVSLWAHECQHAFGDRLTSPIDHARFSRLLLSTAQHHFSQSTHPATIPHTTTTNDDTVLFGSYSTLGHPRYIPSRISTFTREIAVHMAESTSHSSSNSNSSSSPLTLFPDAARHLASLLRALQLPGGRALLVLGHPAAAGRRTLAALAAHVLDYVMVQVPVSVTGMDQAAYGTGQWRADMRRAMRIAGGLGGGSSTITASSSTTTSTTTTTSSGGRQVLLLLPNVAAVPKHVLADVDHLIHAGEPPASTSSSVAGGSAAPLDTEEHAAICREMAMAVAGEGENGRSDGAQGNADVLYNRFLQRVRARLHVVACVGVDAASAAVLREFPAFAAGAAVDVYGEWSSEALHAVAHARLADCASLEVTGDQLPAIVSACVSMHTAAATIPNNNIPLTSNTLVSAGSFLELLSLFSACAMRHSNESAATVRRLESGVARLQDAVKAVVHMRTELGELIARLNKSTVKIDGLVHTVLKEQMQVDAARDEVKQQEASAASDALAAEETALEAQRELDAILPLMQEATRQLAGLQKGDIAELKSLTKPPEGVLLVAEALCTLFGRAPVDDPRSRRTHMHDATMTELEKKESTQQAVRLGYWKAARQLMSQTNFLQLLRGFDKDHADPKVMLAVQGFIESPLFEPDAVGKQSVAARSICVWIRALAAYNDAAVRGVAPKMERLRELAARRDAAKAVLAVHRHELRDIESRHEALQHRYEAAEAERAGLIDNIRDSKAKVERAGRLTDALACEEERWLDKVHTLTARQRGDLGNLLLNCAHVAYAGPLAPAARKEAGAQWSVALKECGIVFSEDYEFAGGVGVATDVSSTRERCMDTHANENGHILKQCRRVPLLLDPHGQGEQWVKSVGWPHGLVVSNASSPTIVQALSECMAEGRVLLLQGVGAVGTDTVLHHVVRAYQRGAGGGGGKLPGEAALPGSVALKEKPKLEAERAELSRLHVQYDDQLQRTEDRILRLLSATSSSSDTHDSNTTNLSSLPAMLEDEALELALSSSAITATELRAHKRVAEAREGAISAEQGAYIGVASRAASLFACAETMARRRGVREAGQTLDGFLAAARRALREIAGPGEGVGVGEDEEQQLRARVAHVTDALSMLLFKHVCRALFDRDKLLLAAMLCVRVLETEDGIPAEHTLLLLGAVAKANAAAEAMARTKPMSRSPTSPPPWLTGNANGWQELQSLERHFPEQLHGICEHIQADSEPWKYLHDSPAPEKHPLPSPWSSTGNVATTTTTTTTNPNINPPPLPDLYRLAIVRCLRPDRTLRCVETLVTSRLGEGYARPAAYSLSQACADSGVIGGNRVVVCVAEAGMYPADEIRECAAGMIGKKEGGGVARVHHVAMGHNQAARAEAAIMEASHSGGWVVLQNCHLESNFLHTLPALLDDLFSISSSRPPVHSTFRLWLTVSPNTTLPSPLLTHAVRVAVVPPPSTRTRMLRALATCRADNESKEKDVDLVSLSWPALFQLAAAHALAAGRGRYPSVGWCGVGEGEGSVDLWNVGDLRAARAEVLACVARAKGKAGSGGSVGGVGGGEEGHSGGVAEPPRLPVKALRYVLGEVVYGGRVVDARDRRVLGLLFEEALPLTVEASASSPHGTEVSMLSAPPMSPTSGNNNSFFPSRHFPAHYSVLSYEAACAYAERGLPAHDSAPLFGLHEHADASLTRAHARMLQHALVSIHAPSLTTASREEALLNKVNECMLALPSTLLVGDLDEDTSDDVHTPVVFAHEARCYNVLLNVVFRSLQHMKEALNERALNSSKLEESYDDLVRDKVLVLWRRSSYSTLETSLSLWLRNLNKRIATVRELLEHTEQTPVHLLHPMYVITLIRCSYNALSLPVQRLVSAVAQAYAHANGMPLDAVHVCAVPMGDVAHTHVHMHGFAAGCFLSGVRMQGAGWDAKAMVLAEPGRATSTAMGLIWLKPGRSPALMAATEATYSCPVYQTAGCVPRELLFYAELPCPASQPAKHWIRRGVTMFCGEANE
eukprot:jgi/Chlat1/3943/Chrsp26S04196